MCCVCDDVLAFPVLLVLCSFCVVLVLPELHVCVRPMLVSADVSEVSHEEMDTDTMECERIPNDVRK